MPWIMRASHRGLEVSACETRRKLVDGVEYMYIHCTCVLIMYDLLEVQVYCVCDNYCVAISVGGVVLPCFV